MQEGGKEGMHAYAGRHLPENVWYGKVVVARGPLPHAPIIVRVPYEYHGHRRTVTWAI